MDDETQVYCTDCKYFRLNNEGSPWCCWSDICELSDCEDSKPHIERWMYYPRVTDLNSKI